MTRSGFILVGAILVLLGIAGLAVPVFTAEQTKDVAKLGDLKLQAKEDTTHFVPPLLSSGVLAVGIILVGAGFVRGRAR